MENFAKNQWGSNSYSTLFKNLRTMASYIYIYISHQLFDDSFWRTMVKNPKNCFSIQKGYLFWFLITTQH